MKRTTLKSMKCGIIMTVVMLMISVVPVTAQSVTARDEAPERRRRLEGVWMVQITPRNCTTGVPNPTAAFEALITFHKGGTLSAWFQNSTITTTRGPSYGLWQRDSGWSDYSFKFVHLRYNLSTGAFIGRQETGGTLVLSESGDEYTSIGSTQGFDVNGNPSGTGGCSTSVGTRFSLEP